MDVVVDVLHAVAVVAIALGAVPELHVGVVRVGNAAHGALVEVALVLPDLLLGLFKVNGLGICAEGGPLASAADHAHQVIPEENEVVEDGHQG